MALRTMRLSVSINLTPVIPRSTPKGTCFAARSDVGIRIFLDRNLRKTQNLCVLETDCHASVYPKGTCFAARTGSQ